MLMRLTQASDHLPSLEHAPRLAAAPVFRCHYVPEVLAATHRRCPVLRGQPEYLLTPLREHADHRSWKTVGARDKIADSETPDRPEAVRCQNPARQRLRAATHEGERRHLDGPALDVCVELLRVQR